MSDDNEKVVEAKNQGKNPTETAINKLREAKIKELQAKVDQAAKTAYDAHVVSEKMDQDLKIAIENLEEEKARINEFARTLK